ncbi:diacylglycerol kinase [Telluria mixta]|jgi:diacylglycerol kinase (ATP)|uniref:Diacylglycerol kinase n=1 Tax=Telluria mixta TaxID=34071 RepID=A0ABT2C251_9BURK|nr:MULTISPECIES: diacylglycerol kinase [Telluria group]KGF78663.1 DeoR faimly transcriptional regulator [Massilia sp. JS1662]MCS0611427.1 diacylglycerol kinase [Massilia kyonggiensis]MCS0630916.1 diacylglycerol kinase [Telluria mixta]WEM98917.1 diacylglycerol kinase [Telluria mixta]
MDQPSSEFKSKGGLGRIAGAFRYSMQGFQTAWKNEHAFRQEVMVAVPLTVVALLLKISAFQKLALIAVLGLVLLVELINAAIEAVVDRVSLERHPLSKAAKDLGSAAVALAITMAGATWAVVLYNRFF